MFEARTTEELIRIAVAGGGFEIHVGARTTEDLIRIASASASNGRGRLFMRGIGTRATEDLVRIAAAGDGSVVFADPLPD